MGVRVGEEKDLAGGRGDPSSAWDLAEPGKESPRTPRIRESRAIEPFESVDPSEQRYPKDGLDNRTELFRSFEQGRFPCARNDYEPLLDCSLEHAASASPKDTTMETPRSSSIAPGIPKIDFTRSIRTPPLTPGTV